MSYELCQKVVVSAKPPRDGCGHLKGLLGRLDREAREAGAACDQRCLKDTVLINAAGRREVLYGAIKALGQ
jgi:hypothetical protein